MRRTQLGIFVATAMLGAAGMAAVFSLVGQPLRVEGATASPYVIHIPPGGQVTVIADGSTSPATPSPVVSPSPTAAPTLTAPTCSVSIQGTDVWITATGLMPGALYAVWWHTDKPDGTTYDASGNEIAAKADGTWRFVYDLTPGHTEVYVYQKHIVDNHDVAYGDPSAAVAECEYDA